MHQLSLRVSGDTLTPLSEGYRWALAAEAKTGIERCMQLVKQYLTSKMITYSVRQNSGALTLCLFICCCGSVTGLTIRADTLWVCSSTFQKRRGCPSCSRQESHTQTQGLQY